MHVPDISTRPTELLDRIRRPEYTGENRCLPCTAVNLAIAGVASAAVWLASPPTAVAVAAGSLAAIGLRGYLVPGTPALTKRYFPDWLLRAFEKAERPPTEPVVLDAEATLLAAGALRADPSHDDVALAPDFETEWRATMARLAPRRADADALARLLDVEPDRLALTPHGEAFVARLDGRWAGQWESRAAFVADLAAASVLESRVEGWSDLPLSHRSELLGGLRLCLERCPVCDGDVVLEETVVESCCRSIDVVASTCRDCDARLFEAEWNPAALGVA